MNLTDLQLELIQDEDIKLSLYKCPTGHQTIGVGHNLDAKPISHRAAMVILEDDIMDTIKDLDEALPWWRSLNEVRQHVIINMCFNMGIMGLLGFRNTLLAMREQRWDSACRGMQASLWYSQVGERAVRLVARMRTGK